ncbi:MAG TPA: prolyl oligopeptidase family serine peptidase [Gemmatimonadaceae bacterium]
MTKKALTLMLLCATAAAGAQQSKPFDFSIKNIMRGPELYGRQPQNVRWSADSKWIYFTWLEPGTDWRETPRQFRVRAVPGAKPERVSIREADTTAARFTSGELSHNGRYLVVETGGDLYIDDLSNGTTRRLTQTVEEEKNPQFSIDDRQVFFVRNNNVYTLNLTNGFLRQLTDIRQGSAPTDSARAQGQRGRLEQQQRDLFESVRDRARTDSIARVERLLRDSLALKPVYLQSGEQVNDFSISPSGTTLLVSTRIPASGQRTTDIPQYVTRSGYTEELRVRTKVGDTEQKGRVALITLPAATITWLKPFPADTTAGAFSLLGWNDAGTRALLYAYSGDNKYSYLETVDPTGKLTTLEALRDSAWVGGACSPCGGWYGPGEGRVWYTSEADGYSHLYTITPSGSDRRQLTRGRWEVRDVAMSVDRRWFYLLTNEVTPFEQHLYRMPASGGAMERITTKVGKHTAVVSPDGQLVADVYSYVNRPPDLFLMRNRPNAEESQLTASPSAEWLSFPWLAPEIVMVPASDGVKVPAHIYRPSDMKAQPNGSAVIFVHGAGYLHNVGNFWSEYPREYMFNQFLASKGYTVLDLDYRGSDGYGRDWRTAIYRHMGGRDLQDQVDASRYLAQNFQIDPKRIGIYGGSYGGFITLMALFTESSHFGAGAALRSVTDWAHYNQGYTSNILNLPQNDTIAYRQSSPIYFAEGLQDPLLMAHGMVDTNVHFQDIVRLTQRLIELGKTRWELAVYPVEDHAFVRPSSWADEYRRIFELFERYLPTRTTSR